MRRTDPSPEVKLLVQERDKSRCVLCGVPAVQQHHRRPRGMGGTRLEWINLPANIISLCLECHQHVESHRTWAYKHGFLIRMGGNTAEMIPLTYPDRWARLFNDGTQETLYRKAIS